MKYTTIIDPNREEEVLIHAQCRSALVEELERLCDQPLSELVGYRGDQIRPLSPGEVHCFTIEAGKLYAMTDEGAWQLRRRLYELEEGLGKGFVRINQSCIVSIKQIKRFEASVGGALLVILKNGHRDYVSRRQLKTVKERIGFHL